ncbi:MAG TPA: hypothetical protein VHH36_04300 [Candidatus Thermoplasmatota archaeon]|nr:hypothetical protein [Candidatus Thermoplasmatota archaeon]
MGREAECTMRRNGRAVQGKAFLETDGIVFRGPERLVVPRKDVTAARAESGRLILETKGDRIEFDLGAQAEKWAHDVLHPKSRLDKIGVKPGQRVALAGVTDATLADEVAQAGAEVLKSASAKDLDILFLQIDEPDGLARVEKAPARIRPDGAVWVVTPRGVAGVKDVDVKVMRFSETHTALKLVVPKKKRG